ncbi:MAG: aromatic ring-hydroxylating dioxygenase subunit alpha [Rhodospirillaceae bacterium]|jgi:5,5'-dehydrodivanillate O-demethylase|nr:aromatic ring-hydroxylating dioxygenase subunit alpha [Rhodospirillaceae bacterium]MBT3884907.1 aromatic ring-hydroxylating dioxygenase subunit alpha [Rhodospirillaceae bacterium]MBT4116781.1 aromatic ring-hydroxylating dioxygenase subunit alpha [Rhodospirillaceae bacterium]MBT4674228.1 aromatic ring-hydroxylating dioxygenase subunit alpha [Rhodospirillaceae bacterium]MBT4720907.1 aromatic ring-hydroxylating dioxygenase subunit alpha [Rhodospirillaceae bacterium]
MLEQDRNERLMQVGPETPMGKLMRRYWHPIAAASEFEDIETKPVRLMGEDLVLYKDRSDTYGLVDRHCPHRRADLSYGFVEDCGLRCNYHGWLFDEKGDCIHQPYEDTIDPESKLRGQVKVKAYKVQELAGLLFAYMGPEPAPLVPNWEPFTWKNGFVRIVFTEVPCNWFQCQENSIDPVHFEWMHDNWSIRLGGKTGPYTPKHLKVDFKEFEYGYSYHRVKEDTDENNPLWTVGRNCLWPNMLFTGEHFEYRVPIDDETTLSVGWFFNRVPKEKEPFEQKSIPSWVSPVKDEETGRWITSHVMNQDFVAWVGQGEQADRTQEHLGRSDKGVAMIRKQFFDDMEAIERGEDPMATIRDEKLNECIELPIIGKEVFVNGMTTEEIVNGDGQLSNVMKRFAFQVGQPDHIKQAFEDATGIKQED